MWTRVPLVFLLLAVQTSSVLAAGVDKPVSLSLHGSTLSQALGKLFAGTDMKYVLDSGIQDCSVPDIALDGFPFRSALRSILKPVNLVAEENGDTFLIHRTTAVENAQRQSGKAIRVDVPSLAIWVLESQSYVLAPAGCKLVLLGKCRNSTGSPQQAVLQLGMKAIQTVDADTRGVYALPYSQDGPGNSRFRILEGATPLDRVIVRTGVFAFYDRKVPLCLESAQMTQPGKLALRVSGKPPETLGLVYAPCDDPDDVRMTLAEAVGDEPGHYEAKNMHVFAGRQHAAWIIAEDSELLVVGTPATFAVPAYLSIASPEPNGPVLLADSAPGTGRSRVALTAQNLTGSLVQVSVDGEDIAGGRLEAGELALDADFSRFPSGSYTLSARATLGEVVIESTPQRVAISNASLDSKLAKEEQDRMRAQLAAQYEQAKAAQAQAARDRAHWNAINAEANRPVFVQQQPEQWTPRIRKASDLWKEDVLAGVRAGMGGR